MSTDEVYGDIPDGHSVETDPLAPRSPYAAAKASSELLVRAYHITYGLDVVLTRGSNTYGPHQHPEKLIPLFTTNALAGEPLPMYGDGMQVRDWLHVSDHAAGIDFVLRHGGVRRGLQRGRRAKLLPNREVIGLLLEAAGRDWSLVRTVPDRPGHDRRYAMDGSKLAALGWVPRVAFEDGPARRRSPGTATTPSGSRARGAATGTATTSASTGRAWRPAAPSSSRARRAERGAGRRRRGQRAARARAGRGARERALHRDPRARSAGTSRSSTSTP